MKTIGFFGDSFCASNQPESWCNILQEKLGANRIRWFGNPGRSIWSVFFQVNKLIEQNRVPDICIFCWTEPHRLYHPELILSIGTKPLEGVDPNIYKTLDNYWKYLHSTKKSEMSYEYALKYYDQNVLAKLKNKTIVQLWSFKPDTDIKLSTGTFINECMFTFSKSAGEKHGWGIGTINHMTEEQNKEWANKVYGRLNI
jgi:hypothetical protein